MKSAGLIPSASIYTNLISIYGRNGDYEKALHLLAVPRFAYILPLLVYAGHVMLLSCSDGMKEMKVDGHQPKEVSYEALMQACKKASKVGLLLPVSTHTRALALSLSFSLTRAQYDRVLELFEEMKSVGAVRLFSLPTTHKLASA
jgi:hypothetical protein